MNALITLQFSYAPVVDIFHSRKLIQRLNNNERARRLIFNPNLGGLFRVHFEWGGGGGGKLSPSSLKLVRIVLETSNLVRKYTRICSFRKYTF